MSLVTPTVAPTLTLAPELKLAPEFDSPGSTIECCPGCCNCFSSNLEQDFQQQRLVVNHKNQIKPEKKGGLFSRLFKCCCPCIESNISHLFKCLCPCTSDKEKPRMMTGADLHDYLTSNYGEHEAGIVESYLQFKNNESIKVEDLKNGIERAQEFKEIKKAAKIARFELCLIKASPASDREEKISPHKNVTIKVIKDQYEEEFKEETIEKKLKKLGIEEEFIQVVTPKIKDRIIESKNEEEETECIEITPKEITGLVASELKAQNYHSPKHKELNDPIINNILESKKPSQFTVEDFIALKNYEFFNAKKTYSDIALKNHKIENMRDHRKKNSSLQHYPTTKTLSFSSDSDKEFDETINIIEKPFKHIELDDELN